MEWAFVLSGVAGIGILLCFAMLFHQDIKHQKLPNELIIILTIFCSVFLVLTEIVIEQKSYSTVLFNHALALIPITVLYGVIYIVSRGRMIGLGDVKLGVPIAILLPWQGAVAVLGLSNVLALIVIIIMLTTKKAKPNTKVPFGPFLIVATLLVFVMKFFVDFF